MNLGGIDVIKRLVEIGLGVALVPRVAVRAEVEAGRLMAIRVRGMAPRQIGLVEHRGRRRGPSALAFLGMVRNAYKEGAVVGGLDVVKRKVFSLEVLRRVRIL